MFQDVTAQFWIILGVAILLLVTGIVIYLLLIRRSNPKLFYSNAIVSWLLISLFPVVLLFSVFQSSASAEMKDTTFGTITVGGAFGAFFVLWIMGTWNTMKAINADYSEETIKTLNEQIRSLQDQYKALGTAPRDTRIIAESRKIEFTVKKNKRTLGLYTGDIQQVRGVDFWVNSENTNFQMARFYDSSISGLIRYLGAERDKEGNVTKDIIADALRDCVKDENIAPSANNNVRFPSIKPGLALMTESGKLRGSHGVHAIIHVATVFGEIGQGYTSIKNLGVCVQNALDQADQHKFMPAKKKVSIIFPLFGTGTAGGSLEAVAKNLFYSVLSYFEARPNSQVQQVYFLVWKEYEKETCMRVLNEMDGLLPKRPD